VADDLDQVVLLSGQADVETLSREWLDVGRTRAVLDRSEAQVG
jgi:hypothetical protein